MYLVRCEMHAFSWLLPRMRAGALLGTYIGAPTSGTAPSHEPEPETPGRRPALQHLITPLVAVSSNSSYGGVLTANILVRRFGEKVVQAGTFLLKGRHEQIGPQFRRRPLRGPRTLVSQVAPRRSRLHHPPGRARFEIISRQTWLPCRGRGAHQRSQKRGFPGPAGPWRVHAGQIEARA